MDVAVGMECASADGVGLRTRVSLSYLQVLGVLGLLCFVHVIKTRVQTNRRSLRPIDLLNLSQENRKTY